MGLRDKVSSLRQKGQALNNEVPLSVPTVTVPAKSKLETLVASDGKLVRSEIQTPAQTVAAGPPVLSKAKPPKVKKEPPVTPQPKKKKPPTMEHGSPGKRDFAQQVKGRLPSGSQFTVAWDGEQWKGVLLVQVFEPFHNAREGVFKLLAALDTMYRDGLEKRGVVVEAVKEAAVAIKAAENVEVPNDV